MGNPVMRRISLVTAGTALICFLATAAFAIVRLRESARQADTGPEILKVEPPGWWAAHSINPVRLLIRGRHLKRARVESSQPGVRSALTRVNETGDYAFIDLSIDRNTKPGRQSLKLVTPGGTAEIPFEILARLPREGNFQGFTTDDVIYLIMTDRFSNGDLSNDDPAISRGLFDRSKPRYYHGGDFQGVINRLPYLKDLGVTAIWLTPIYDNNNRLNERETYDGQPITDYHGYGAVDYYAVEEHFGDLKKYRELVRAAHALGMKVIQDQIANHCGPYHPWVEDAPLPTWFHGTRADHLANNWQTHFLTDPAATPELLRPVLDGWFINLLPDLNQDEPEVSRYVIQNTLWWLGVSGEDAIRQDTLPYVPRRFWRDWMSAIKREYPRVNVVGETLDKLPAQVAFFQGGAKRFDGIDSRIDSEFDYPLYYAIRRAFAQGGSIREVVAILNQDYLYPAPGELVTLLGSHDVARFMNEPGATVDGLKLAFTLLLTMRGTPEIYYGDEIGMRGGEDPDNRRDFPGGWPDDGRSAFEPSGRNAEEEVISSYARKVARLRGSLEPLRRGRLIQLAVEDQVYVFARASEKGVALVAINNARDGSSVEFTVSAMIGSRVSRAAVLKDRLGSNADLSVADGKARCTLAPRSAAIYSQ
jgi:neopullulanase